MNTAWTVTPDFLIREFIFSDFASAIKWMLRLVPEIESLDHHPEWTNSYNKITVRLTTHSAGNKVTDKDYALARLMDKHFSET